MPTIKDLARVTGLTVGTVSRAFHDRYTDIGSETKRRVLQAAQDIGYTPNRSAQNLSLKSTDNIALLSIREDFVAPDEILMQLMAGSYRYANEQGLELATFMQDGSFRTTKTYDQFCAEHSLRGLLLFGVGLDDPYIHDLVGDPYTCVTVDVETKGQRVGNVLTDDATAFEEAAEFLMAHHHKRFAVLMGHPQSTVTRARWSGLSRAMARHGIQQANCFQLRGDFKQEMAHDQVSTFLKTYGREVTAFLCMSDAMAVGTVQAIQAAGLRVPEDYSVMGYDGLMLSALCKPRITTIDQHFVEKGYQAAKLLDTLLKNPKAEKRVIVPHRLVLGDSMRQLS